jgi:hypothetical protein
MAEHESKDEEAAALHHLATADPEIDGPLTGPAHEAKYGLKRAAESAAHWIAAGVHPFENRALGKDEKVSAPAPAADKSGGHAAPDNEK